MKIILLTLGICLTSCGSPSSEESSGEPKTSSSEQIKVAPRTPSLFDAQIDSMAKAENVEDTVLKADQARKQKMQDL